MIAAKMKIVLIWASKCGMWNGADGIGLNADETEPGGFSSINLFSWGF